MGGHGPEPHGARAPLLTSAGCNLETWGWGISCSPSPWSSPPPRCTAGAPCSTGGEGEPMARAGRGKALLMWGQRITSHICHFRYTVALFWPVRSAPKVNKSRRIISFFLIGNLVGCDSLFIMVLKIRTSYMSEFRYIEIILVLSNFFYLTSKTFQRSKKSTVVKFSHWWIDS